MDKNLPPQKNVQSHVEKLVGYLIGDLGKEIIALHIQKNRHISFISHKLIDFIDIKVLFYFFLLQLHIFDKVTSLLNFGVLTYLFLLLLLRII